MTDLDPRTILGTPMPEGNDADAATIGDYLIRLLSDVWEYGEGFDGKRPFGNSGWEWDLYAALAKAGHITGVFDQDGYVEGADTPEGRSLVADAIKAMPALLAEVKRQQQRAENAEAGVMKHAKQVDQTTTSHEQMKTRLREAEANAKDLEDARTADGKRMVQADNKIRELEQQLAQVAKIADQIGSAAASDVRNRDARIEAAIERDGVWSSSRDPGIARISAAIDIQTSIAKRLRRALAGGEGQ